MLPAAITSLRTWLLWPVLHIEQDIHRAIRQHFFDGMCRAVIFIKNDAGKVIA
ncbi:hypothetical protein [Hufsiella ginkgonis]|uniref:Uncharacterized protein n=1 Tax=Hufsiella ginkgonis TaxID=2695274 RepID=A0A7K1Y2S7_9SPHI|nr:hypothetical protein [Hufsiella ginkgonis]MXV17277.1 hypothetical protein [Hufsiella ginkgonis]